MELWKELTEYDGKYLVSSDGRVMTQKRQGTKGGLLKQHLDKTGYLYVSLCSKGKYRREAVHRLVAKAFIDNPSNFPCVNHKDEIKQNNFAENLEWCSYQYNNNYGTARERATQKRYKPCIGIWSDGTQKVYNSCTLASRDTGVAQGNIWGACNGLWKHAGGVEWHYLEELEEKDGTFKSGHTVSDDGSTKSAKEGTETVR